MGGLSLCGLNDSLGKISAKATDTPASQKRAAKFRHLLEQLSDRRIVLHGEFELTLLLFGQGTIEHSAQPFFNLVGIWRHHDCG